MDAALRAYLARACRRRFGWGSFDCCLFMADWILERTGRDPAEAHRGRYSGVREALLLLKEHGGLLPLAGTLASGAGLLATNAPRPGDVGVVLARKRQAGAIRTRKGWAFLTPTGYAVAALPTLGAWEVR